MTNTTAVTASSQSFIFPKRIGRVSFLVRYLILFFVSLFAAFMTKAAGQAEMTLFALAGVVLLLALLYYLIHFIAIARVRDTGLHAAFALLIFVPLVGSFIFLAMFFIPTDMFRKAETEIQLADLLKEQTGDPAFLHRTDWIVAYGKKDFKTALAKVNQALQIVPNDPLYLALRALTHYSMNNYTDAQSDLKAALQSNPAQKEALDIREAMKADAVQCRDRARELSKKKEIQRALDELNRAVELEPDNPLNFFFRGLTYGQVENYDAAINDVAHTLLLDPQYPDGQKILQSLKNMAQEKKGSTSPTMEPSEQSYFFICTGNPSLVSAYNNLFQVGALAYHGAAGRYYASAGNLDVREQEANKVSLPFVGQSYLDSESTPVSHMHDVLQSLGVAASREIHIAFVSVDQAGVSWVQEVYGELLNQAVSQGILPYEMYVTKDKASAQFLLDSFEKVS
jgi:tetratricopeptide (TPR) repeat protein